MASFNSKHFGGNANLHRQVRQISSRMNCFYGKFLALSNNYKAPVISMSSQHCKLADGETYHLPMLPHM